MLLEDNNFLHGCWNYCLMKTNIDVMGLFKFDIKYVKFRIRWAQDIWFEQTRDINGILFLIGSRISLSVGRLLKVKGID